MKRFDVTVISGGVSSTVLNISAQASSAITEVFFGSTVFFARATRS